MGHGGLKSHAQKVILSGVVSDSAKRAPLPRANIVIREENGRVQFVSSNMEGFYTVDLRAGARYKATVSYIGYHPAEKEITFTAEEERLDFRLQRRAEQLEDIVVTHRYEPIKISKDTVAFQVRAFLTGTERKLRDVLEKLPGVEVGDGGEVIFQGKRVQITTVESKPFFGGGSKLAVENIPSDAIEEIQMLDNFHEVDFMKDFVQSDRLAMNVKLKKDKKEFVFGDAEVQGGPDNYYAGQAGFFYYTPKNTGGLITHVNNIGKAPLSHQEMSMLGDRSSIGVGGPQLFNLASLGRENQNVFASRAALFAGNAHVEVNEKFKVDAYALNYDNKTQGKELERISLFDVTGAIPEERVTQREGKSNLTVANLTIETSPSRYRRGFYGANFQEFHQGDDGVLHSQSIQGDNSLGTESQNKGRSLKQLFEQYRNYDVRRSDALELNYTYAMVNPQTNYITEDSFFASFPGVLADSLYIMQSMRRRFSHNVKGTYRYYFLLDGTFQLNILAEGSFISAGMKGQEDQLLSEGSVHNFEPHGFGNDIRGQFYTGQLGAAFKWSTRRLTSTIALLPTFLGQRLIPGDTITRQRQLLLMPTLDAKWSLREGHAVNFSYRLRSRHPSIQEVAPGGWLAAFNIVQQGNSDIFYEQFHDAQLRYNTFRLEDQRSLFVIMGMQRRTRSIRSNVSYAGIIQHRESFLSILPEKSHNMTVNYSKRFGRFRPMLRTSMSSSEQYQYVNTVSTKVSQKMFSYQGGLQFTTSKNGSIDVSFRQLERRMTGIRKQRFSTSLVRTKLNLRLGRSVVFNPVYSYLSTSFDGRADGVYHGLDLSLTYEFKNSAWSFVGNAGNLLDNGARYSSRLGDYYRLERETQVMPRTIILGIGYSL